MKTSTVPLSLLLPPQWPLQSFLSLPDCLAAPVVWPCATTKLPAVIVASSVGLGLRHSDMSCKQ